MACASVAVGDRVAAAVCESMRRTMMTGIICVAAACCPPAVAYMTGWPACAMAWPYMAASGEELANMWPAAEGLAAAADVVRITCWYECALGPGAEAGASSAYCTGCASPCASSSDCCCCCLALGRSSSKANGCCSGCGWARYRLMDSLCGPGPEGASVTGRGAMGAMGAMGSPWCIMGGCGCGSSRCGGIGSGCE
ncbi:ATP synthase subunit alpha [Frankliniella fusca]|uniref:ATP synthase subunit alpha n=1 Tax=Frankliniella fusca TaxID=407009 RepID=A0AAE1LDH3_9NEOP|nr:ATP synthase subunit alpha [Frankliniella fusca]